MLNIRKQTIEQALLTFKQHGLTIPEAQSKFFDYMLKGEKSIAEKYAAYIQQYYFGR